MVRRGYAFLDGVNQAHAEWGGDCLVGLTFVKRGAEASHPAVRRAVERVRQVLSQPNFPEGTAYSPALAGVFLCELDAQTFRPEIDRWLAHLFRTQQPGCAWGYPNSVLGDTSQTQYGVLCLLTAKRAGIPVPHERVERAAAWLCRTQDVGGGWGYQGQDTNGGQRAVQSGVSLSMSAAGAGSVLICGDMLGVNGPALDRENTSPDLPPGLTLVPEHNARLAGDKKLADKDATTIRRAAADANRWFDRNYNIEYPTYQHYYLYALERYQAFRELAARRDEQEPQWYNDGVALLSRTQAADGSWSSTCGAPVDTCFAILFLTRSTKKSFPQPGEGTLTGGRGFPGNISHAKLVDGKIVGDKPHQDVAQLLAAGDIDGLVDFRAGLPLESDPSKRASQLPRVRRLVAANDVRIRLIAVKTLGKSDDFDSIPILIYALTDPKWDVVRAANEALRHIARHFDGSLSADAPDETERQAAIVRWKHWYTSVHPQAVFLNAKVK